MDCRLKHEASVLSYLVNPVNPVLQLVEALLAINFHLYHRANLLADQLKSKTLSQQMIEELLCFGTGFRPATQANALFECSIDQVALGHDLENLIESGFDRRLVNLLQPKIAFQSLPADGPLLHAQ